MAWANVTKIHTPPSAKRYSPPPDEHALYKDNFATVNAFSFVFSPPEAAASVDEIAWNGELSKVIADITKRDGNMLFLFHEP